MNRRHITWISLLVLSGVAAGVAYWVNSNQDPIPAGLIRSNGRLEVERIEIAAKYPGRIIELPVHEGDQVKAGDLIARQDSTELLAQKAAVEAARQRASQAMARAQAETDVRKVQARIAQLELDHTTRLRQDALVSGAEVERRDERGRGQAHGAAPGDQDLEAARHPQLSTRTEGATGRSRPLCFTPQANASRSVIVSSRRGPTLTTSIGTATSSARKRT